MKYFAIRLVVALSTFIIGLASTALLSPFHSTDIPDQQAEQEILRVEHEYIRAHLERDTDTLDQILADEFTIRTYYREVSKAQRLALLESPGFAFENIDTDNVQVHVTGDQAAVTGEAVVITRDEDREYISPHYHFIRQYEKRQGRWQIVSVRVMR